MAPFTAHTTRSKPQKTKSTPGTAGPPAPDRQLSTSRRQSVRTGGPDGPFTADGTSQRSRPAPALQSGRRRGSVQCGQWCPHRRHDLVPAEHRPRTPSSRPGFLPVQLPWAFRSPMCSNPLGLCPMTCPAGATMQLGSVSGARKWTACAPCAQSSVHHRHVAARYETRADGTQASCWSPGSRYTALRGTSGVPTHLRCRAPGPVGKGADSPARIREEVLRGEVACVLEGVPGAGSNRTGIAGASMNCTVTGSPASSTVGTATMSATAACANDAL